MSLKVSLLGVIFCITLCIKGDFEGYWDVFIHEEVPIKAFEGGVDRENGPAYIIRANFQGFILPGKYTLFSKRASVSWEGKEHTVDKYEFLFNYFYDFVPNGEGIPSDAVVGGHSESGEPFYICRTFKGENEDVCIGRLHSGDEKCYVGYNGVEYKEDVFEILVVIWW